MLMATTSGMLVAVPAQAASLQQVASGWASGVPSYVSMFIYVPDRLASPPPIVVASHFCGGNANAMFNNVSSIVSVANNRGFIMIFPQTSNNCWDVGSTQSLTHDGGGDTQAIAEMVKYTITKYSADAGRVYAMGISSGAMMTEALLGVYPDMFKAGAEFSGVPDGCWAASYSPSNQWSGPCASGQVSKTAQQWGDIVRAQFPGYTGLRPRVQLWHGTADATINYNNMGEAIKEWTNVLGLSATPTTTDAPLTGFMRKVWDNSCGFSVLEAWTQQNGVHTTPVDANAVISFFGLDKTGPDMGASECADGGTSGSSSSSSGGSSSSSGSGGSSGSSSSSSGSGGSSGSSGSGGSSGSSGGRSSSGSSGASSGSGGSSGSSGASSGSGGSSGSSGASSGSGGSNGSSGASSGSGGSSGSSGASSGSGGSSGSSGASSGTTSDGGSAFGASNFGGTASPGCGCRVGAAEERFGGGMLLAPIGAVLGTLLRRRRRPRA
jgi:acetylxylan esterase